MTKAELIKNISEDAGISRTAARDALESFITNVIEGLSAKEGKVTLVGFGTFRKTRLEAREGRNPQTGEAIKIKSRNVIRFKAGKKLRESV